MIVTVTLLVWSYAGMTDKYWLQSMSNILDSYADPAVLIDEHYYIVAANRQYEHRFGSHHATGLNKCFELSHGYQRPCDLEGETCPMQAANQSGTTSSVLHIHNTAQGKEHMGIETTPVTDQLQRRFFIEVMKPIREVSAEPIANKMIGRSPAFNQLVDLIQRVGATETNVLLTGPSGSGKELAAQAVHAASARTRKPFVTVECSGLTDTLFESELFGHVKGAFTGASSNRKGLVESARGGTLFLDEVGDIPLHLQVKLLRLIETRTFRPVGENQPFEADFRLICATHKDLPAMVEKELFREDLFHRISTFPIQLPSLKERIEDLSLLVKSILLRIEVSLPLTLSPAAMRLLEQQPFSGNIRELKNILERAVVLREGLEISADVMQRALDLSPICRQTQTDEDKALTSLAQAGYSLESLERVYIKQLLSHYQDKTRVAEIAGCSLRTLYRKLKEGE
ncbi:sigma-54-dependent Fis family transcriptional regulator [uncultured Neptuniibacter sp.]|uniref:sigma-54 interaction domain-containing protein n=1 Tax=uncultured Neptuniibacter sp. TaxID=502143 RepID=UPI002613DD2B|nr:sigma-54-dependent Fis family transcriptional regulator [uncultured Neptuniibacter sp.]